MWHNTMYVGTGNATIRYHTVYTVYSSGTHTKMTHAVGVERISIQQSAFIFHYSTHG